MKCPKIHDGAAETSFISVVKVRLQFAFIFSDVSVSLDTLEPVVLVSLVA